MDAVDKTIEETATRECYEEIGHSSVDVLGLWHDVPNKDRTVAVTPVVGWLGEIDPSRLKVNESEVTPSLQVLNL